LERVVEVVQVAQVAPETGDTEQVDVSDLITEAADALTMPDNDGDDTYRENLKSMTVEQLTEVLEELGIEYPRNSRKADLIDLLVEHRG